MWIWIILSVLYSDLCGRLQRRVSVIGREGKWEMPCALSKQCVMMLARFTSLWGTQGTARCSDLSEISQQTRGRNLSHLVHLKITYEWHMAMHLWYILFYIYGAEAPGTCLAGKAHRHTLQCLWYTGFCFIIYLCFDIFWESHLNISRTTVFAGKTFVQYEFLLSTLF